MSKIKNSISQGISICRFKYNIKILPYFSRVLSITFINNILHKLMKSKKDLLEVKH